LERGPPDTRTKVPVPTVEAPPIDQSPFTTAERQWFQGEDRKSAGAIVGLLVGIFLLALVGYGSIVVWVTTDDAALAVGSLIGWTYFLSFIAYVAWLAVSRRDRRR
jgi:hypothetical protein